MIQRPDGRTLLDVPYFPEAQGRTYWIGPPAVYPEDAVNGAFLGAKLQCKPNAGAWSTFANIHVTGPAVVPSSVYRLEVGNSDCIASGEASCLAALVTVTTMTWGDIVAPYGGGSQPDFVDVGSLVAKFKSLPTAPSKTQAQLQPNDPDPARNVGFVDIGQGVNAFKRLPYPYAGPPNCP